jgi:hypothetical protein
MTIVSDFSHRRDGHLDDGCSYLRGSNTSPSNKSPGTDCLKHTVRLCNDRVLNGRTRAYPPGTTIVRFNGISDESQLVPLQIADSFVSLRHFQRSVISYPNVTSALLNPSRTSKPRNPKPKTKRNASTHLISNAQYPFTRLTNPL